MHSLKCFLFAPRPTLRRVAVLAGSVATIAACALSPANAQTVTDITLFRLDSNNNTINEGANTRGLSFDSDQISNLYLKSGGSFINNGDGAGVNVAIDLSVPATYTFSFAMENVNGNTGPQLGINFFFNNNAATPSISARGLSGGGFVADSGLTNTPSFTQVAGANALTFFNAGRQITLSSFSYQTTGGLDQVQSFNNTPGGGPDTNGTFTLTVTGAAAPEPSALALLLPVLPLAGGFLRRRKHAA